MFWCRKFITDTSTHIVWPREFGNAAQAYGYETSERTCLSVALKFLSVSHLLDWGLYNDVHLFNLS